MRRFISEESIRKLIQFNDFNSLDINDINLFFRQDRGIADYAPDGYCQTDPRNGDRIVYNSARARRPHDNRPKDFSEIIDINHRGCVICQGQTTKILDIAPLSEGFTFINKNLFPIFYPFEGNSEGINEPLIHHQNNDSMPVHGYHFLQWTSSYHDKDWHNMPLDDRVVVLDRLAVLEKKMHSIPEMYVSIIKNYGHLVGGSLAHGHQQIGVSNIMPNRIFLDQEFQKKSGETFSKFMLRENDLDLVIKDYGPAILMTPYFMRRPYDMLLLIKDTTKSCLYELEPHEIEAIADGWQDGIRIMMSVMTRIGKEIAYNITTHNGPGAGLYFEFLPYTQEMGGFEHLGLYLCQGNPRDAAQTARDILDGYA